jgi:uncharacterized protein
MRMMIVALIVLIGLGSAGSVRADLDAGSTAYNRGDYITALREWRPLAERGDGVAQYNLGLMYRFGRGVSQDHKEALKWYRRAAEQGITEAQFTLGALYAEGRGVLQDYKKAEKWYLNAAELGHATAQFELGFMYARGVGALQDNVLGHMWYNIAGANGNRFASDNRANIEKRMTPAQIAEAQKLARECMAKKYKNCGR